MATRCMSYPLSCTECDKSRQCPFSLPCMHVCRGQPSVPGKALQWLQGAGYAPPPCRPYTNPPQLPSWLPKEIRLSHRHHQRTKLSRCPAPLLEPSSLQHDSKSSLPLSLLCLQLLLDQNHSRQASRQCLSLLLLHQPSNNSNSSSSDSSRHL